MVDANHANGCQSIFVNATIDVALIVSVEFIRNYIMTQLRLSTEQLESGKGFIIALEAYDRPSRPDRS